MCPHSPSDHRYHVNNYCPQIIDHRVHSVCNFSNYLSVYFVGSVALLVARRTNDRQVVGSRPTKVVCITVLTGNRMGVNCPLWPAATPFFRAVGSWSLDCQR